LGSLDTETFCLRYKTMVRSQLDMPLNREAFCLLYKTISSQLGMPAPVALLVASRYARPGYGDRRVWVRGPGWSDHCVKL